MLTGLLFSSCKEDEKDYRESFMGTYSCSIDEYYHRDDLGIDKHTTGKDTIEVGIVDDSMLYFRSIPGRYYYFDSEKGHIKVDADGEISLYDYWDLEVRAQGKLNNDSIIIREEYKHRHECSTITIIGRKVLK